VTEQATAVKDGGVTTRVLGTVTPRLHRRQKGGGLRLFSSPGDEPRSRRATDLVLLGVAIAGTIAFAFAADPPSRIESAIIGVFDALPSFIDVVWAVCFDLVALWALTLIVLVALRRRWAMCRDLVLSALVAVGLGFLVGWAATGSWPALVHDIGSLGPPVRVPALRLAMCAAVLITASPHLAHPFRRIGHWMVGLSAFSIAALEATTPSGAILALLLAAGAASLVHLVFGSTAGRPGLSDVRAALDELGVDMDTLEVATRQLAGVFTVTGSDRAGQPVSIRVYGRDAWDTQLVAKTWRTVWYRDSDAITLTRGQQAEHEAFLILLAADHGVNVPRVITAGRTAHNDALLVLEGTIQPLATGTDAEHELDDDRLSQMWDLVEELHGADIAHCDLGPRQFGIDVHDRVALLDFSAATVAPTDVQLRADRAQLLVTTTLLVGADRAIAVALGRLGVDGVTELLSYLQPAALGQQERREVRAADLDIDDLRKQTAAAAGVDVPTMAKLRRLTVGGIVRMAILSLAAYALISVFSGVDWDELWSVITAASVGWLLFGLVLAQTPRFAEAIATRGACPQHLPYGPVVALEFAICFINLAIPSSAARIAVNVRFFERQGLPPAQAVAVGGIDGFSGFVVQMILLALLLLFGVGSVDLQLDPSKIDVGHLLWLLAIVVGIVLLMVVIVFAVRKWRDAVIALLKKWTGEIWAALRALKSASKIAQLFGGNLLAQFIWAMTLAVFLEAFGVHVPLGTLLVINIATQLFAGLMPIPGGIGVTEGALIAGLTAAGVDQTVAFGAVMCQRLASFYLPPIWGGYAFHWLERNRYL
jgi:uncharacterized protein (TIRG00374 family)